MRKEANICKRVVPNPVDAPPIRSPQLVHSLIATYVAAKELTEIGTRNGDGMRCFATTAKRATAVEIDKHYCDSLTKRADELRLEGRNLTVVCADYRSAAKKLDADVITWWEQYPLVNLDALMYLRRSQAAGDIRPAAEAILLFDPLWPDDVVGWRRLCPVASWSARVPFDEHRRCLKRNGGVSPTGSETCDRARGHFTVAAFPIRRVRHLGKMTDSDRDACVRAHDERREGVWQFHNVSSHRQ